MSTLYAKKGDDRFCIYCGSHLWRWAQDVYVGDKTSVAMLEHGVGQKWENGMRMVCQKCHKLILVRRYRQRWN